jgi:hypothetical protein
MRGSIIRSFPPLGTPPRGTTTGRRSSACWPRAPSRTPVRARRRVHAPFAFSLVDIGFVWGFCVGAQGA